MRGLDLPHRRYSMPETIMRKFRLGQSSTSSSENSSRSSTRQRRRARRKPAPADGKVDRSSQTSPAIVVDRFFGSDLNLTDAGPLLDSSPSPLNRRASSVPDLSSTSSPLSADGRSSRKFSRPTSASGLGTPSPCRVSCYGPPGHGCAHCSNPWSFTSSDCTLTQTVSDRTTSTQDSTLSVKSTSPSTPTPISWTAEQAVILENSLFQPAGHIIAVHAESILVNPLTVVDSSDNWNYGFAADDTDSRLALAPVDAATLTEDDIGAITSGRKDRGTSIDALVGQPEGPVTVGVQAGGPIDPPPTNKPPEISADDCSDGRSKKKADVERKSRGCRRSQKCQHGKLALKNSRSFPPPTTTTTCADKRCRAEVAVNGGNYKDVKAESAIARYSAVPRSNSMIVNTSSLDYTSDSDLSLTDSLEDPADKNADNWPHTRHDDRLVRGEVSVDFEKNRKRLPKSGDAYAYFLSFSGEQDMIKGCHAPDWLRERLKKREEEMRRHFEVKLNRRYHHQTIVYRKRHANLRNHGGHRSKKPAKAVKWHDRDPPTTVVNVVQQLPDASPAASKTAKDELLSEPDPTAPTPVVNVGNPSPENQSFFHISEVIKIEMSNQLKTIITKEKQINLNSDALLRDGRSVQTSEIINNEDAHNSQKIVMRTNVGNFENGGNRDMIDLPAQASVELTMKEIEAGTQTAPDAGTQTFLEEVTSPEIGTQTVPEKPAVPQIGTQTVPEVGTQTVPEPQARTRTDPEVGTQTLPEIGTQTVSEAPAATERSACGHFRSLLAKPRIQSFRHFLPLFESKADDQTVADVLLSAMKEERVLPGKTSVQQQTASSSSSSDEDSFTKVESSCNTDGPYLSESVQTGESFLVHIDRIETAKNTLDKGEQCDESSIDRMRTEILQTDNKECNTEAFSIPAVVQTRETPDGSFVEAEKDEVTMISQLAKDKGTDVYLEEPVSPTADKSCNTANPLTDSSCNTDNSLIVNEVKPSVVAGVKLKRKDVQFERDVQQTSKSIKKIDRLTRQKRDTPTPYCTRPDPNSTQVLELNVPPCTCHMCTFHKRAHSTDRSTGTASRPKMSGKQPLETAKDKKLSKFPTGNRKNLSKFHRKFEVIPEEKASSTESIVEDVRNVVDESTETAKMTSTTGTMTKDPGRHVSIQEPPALKSDDTTQTSADASVQKNVIHQVNVKKTNLVIGRFKAIPDVRDGKDEGSSSELDRLPDGLEVVRQYKGRAALATTAATGQEELLTLSKGWINFYLLKDNQDPDDLHGETGYHVEEAKIDETVQEYTLEIQATPEPDYRGYRKSLPHSGSKSGSLPEIPAREVKRRHKVTQVNRSNGAHVTSLPDIHNSSSSSSTPEGRLDDSHLTNSSKTRQNHRHALPAVHGTRSTRQEIKARRERREVTAISKTEPSLKVPPDLERNIDVANSTKAVEVARSEHSVSSITSSTVILSESPSPQQLQTFSDRKVQKRSAIYSDRNGIEGTSWTVTVAGSSGVSNQTPPDVEMRLTFAKPNGNQDQDNQECGLMHYNCHQSHHISRSKRQGKMQIEQYKHSLRNERHSLQYVPELRNSKKEYESVEVNHMHDEDLSSRMSPRSKCSEAFSEEGELQVTGLAITPELKPRVPTQSERDLVRRQRYKFTR